MLRALEIRLFRPARAVGGEKASSVKPGAVTVALIMIAVLIMVFQESSYGVIRYLEYAYRLPESCKRDPEYVRQMDNVLNTHLRHTFGFLGLTGIATRNNTFASRMSCSKIKLSVP